MIPLLVVLALKFQLPQPFHRPESCHRFRPTVKCRRRLPTAPEVLRQVPIRRFPATTVADSACAWVAKRKRWPPLDHQVTSQPKSVKVRVVTCHLNRSKWWHLLHNPLMFPVPVRAVAIRPCRPKKPNSKTGNAERTTIRWKLQLKARRRKLPDGPRPPRWPWAKAWLVPRHTWLAVRHHKVPGFLFSIRSKRKLLIFFVSFSPPPRTIIRSASFTCVNNSKARSGGMDASGQQSKYNNNSRRTSHHKPISMHNSALLYR